MDSHESSLKRILGIDLGLKKTGLALSDPLGISVRPLSNLIPKSRAEDIAALMAMCHEYDVEAVVIGYPILSRSKEEGMMARRCRGFAEALHLALSERRQHVSVYLLDETGSSKEAVQRLVASGVPQKRRRKEIDSEAARVLVEAFLSGNCGELLV